SRFQNRNSGEPLAEEKKLSGPDFAEGVSLSEFADGGMVQGHANGEAILVTRRGDAYVAIGASCTHYGGPLAEGLIAGAGSKSGWSKRHRLYEFSSRRDGVLVRLRQGFKCAAL